MKIGGKTSRYLLLLVLAFGAAGAAAPALRDEADQAMATITAAAMRGDMRFLSSDLLEGRAQHRHARVRNCGAICGLAFRSDGTRTRRR